MFEDMELTAGGSYSMWNSWSKLRKEWNLQGWSTKTPHSLGVFYFGMGFFKGCNPLLWKLTCYDLQVSQISKTNLTSVEYLKRHFLNHPACFFFLERTTDREKELLFLVLRYPAPCTGLELLPEPLQKKNLLQTTFKMYVLLIFPTICSSAIWKFLFLRNRSY